MKRYIKANQVTTGDIVVTYRNKIIYDGPISAEPTEIFKNIKNFNPETDLADKHLVQYFERNKDRLSDYAYAQSSYRNGLVKARNKSNNSSLNTKKWLRAMTSAQYSCSTRLTLSSTNGRRILRTLAARQRILVRISSSRLWRISLAS